MSNRRPTTGIWSDNGIPQPGMMAESAVIVTTQPELWLKKKDAEKKGLKCLPVKDGGNQRKESHKYKWKTG